MTRAAGVLLAVVLLSGCADGGDGGGDGGASPDATTLRVEVPGADQPRTDAVAKVVDARLAALGVATDAKVEAGTATFELPRRLTDEERSALTTPGHLVFRPVLEVSASPGPDCATPAGRDSIAAQHTDDAAKVTGCAKEGDAKYLLGPAELAGSGVASARATNEVQPDMIATGEWIVEMTLADAAAWAALTEKHVGKQLAIVLDGVVQSAPMIQESIPGGDAFIAGEFTEAEARALAAVLAGGELPAPVTVSQDG